MKRISSVLWLFAVGAALTIGLVCGARIMEGVAGRDVSILQGRLTEAEIQRDAAVQEAKFWQGTLKRIVEGEPVGRVSTED